MLRLSAANFSFQLLGAAIALGATMIMIFLNFSLEPEAFLGRIPRCGAVRFHGVILPALEKEELDPFLVPTTMHQIS